MYVTQQGDHALFMECHGRLGWYGKLDDSQHFSYANLALAHQAPSHVERHAIRICHDDCRGVRSRKERRGKNDLQAVVPESDNLSRERESLRDHFTMYRRRYLRIRW
jgi:hypothetical protein